MNWIASVLLVLAPSVYLAAFVRLEMGATTAALVVLPPERDLFAVQALLLVAIPGIVFYYGLSFGRNWKAIYLGYGVPVGATLAILAMWLCSGKRFFATGEILVPAPSDVALAIWLAGLRRPDRALAVFTKQLLKSEKNVMRLGVRFIQNRKPSGIEGHLA
jgi:hypothetical protein